MNSYPTVAQLGPLIERSQRIYRIGGRPILAAKLAASGEIQRLPDRIVNGAVRDQWLVPASSGEDSYIVSLSECHCGCRDWNYGAPFIGAVNGYERATQKVCKHVLACIDLAIWQATDGNIDGSSQLDPLFAQASTSEKQRLELVIKTSVRTAFNERGNRIGLANREVVTHYRIQDHNWIPITPAITIGGWMGADINIPDIPALFDHFWPIVEKYGWAIYRRERGIQRQSIWEFRPWMDAPPIPADEDDVFNAAYLYGSAVSADDLLLWN